MIEQGPKFSLKMTNKGIGIFTFRLETERYFGKRPKDVYKHPQFPNIHLVREIEGLESLREREERIIISSIDGGEVWCFLGNFVSASFSMVLFFPIQTIINLKIKIYFH